MINSNYCRLLWSCGPASKHYPKRTMLTFRDEVSGVCMCLYPACACACIRRVHVPVSGVCMCVYPACACACIRRVHVPVSGVRPYVRISLAALPAPAPPLAQTSCKTEVCIDNMIPRWTVLISFMFGMSHFCV